MLLLATLFIVPSCHKHSSPPDNGCITRIIPKVTDYQVSGPQLDSIFAFFRSNNLSTANLQFDSWGSDSIVSPSYSGWQEQVSATPFYNYLPTFTQDAYFFFHAGIYQASISQDGFAGQPPVTDSAAHQTLAGLRSAFLKHANESHIVGGPLIINPPPPPPPKNYSDSCLQATLGYLDAEEIPGSTTGYNHALVKVWKITLLNGFFPLVYVEDDNGLGWGVVLNVP